MSDQKNLVGIYRPVVSDKWVSAIRRENSKNNKFDLHLYQRDRLKTHLYTAVELGALAIATTKEAKQVRDTILESAPPSFFKEITIATRGLAALGQNRNRLVANLDNDKRLEEERFEIAKVLPWQPDFEEYELLPYFFVRFGTIFDKRSPDSICERTGQYLASEISLGPAKVKIIE